MEHHSGTRLLQSIGVASRSIGGLTPPLPNRPSVYRASMADRRRALPPVHWRTFASVHRGLRLLYLQSIGGPPVHRRTCTVDNHSSHQESNEADPLALISEAHDTAYSIHSGSTKMYHDLKERFWWYGMKRTVAEYDAVCDTCQRVKAEHQRPAGLLQPLKIPEWKWEEISMDFIVGLPRTQKGYNSI
ncbi:hypothetical protein U9M48_023839 [Paspalum notatum var. saurae]|uniref:Integrase zinc-binding domain-containing protein n=1 Tax=Paspalum notatum var. saurae TaxID=547442 RepID=A0AAQ3WV30_PASNO